jgi:AraC-like DNA-binding protein
VQIDLSDGVPAGWSSETFRGGVVQNRLERYTAHSLLAPAAQVRVMRQRVWRLDVHWHDFYELVHVCEGRAVQGLNGAEATLAPGRTFLLTPADFHEIAAADGGPLTCCNVVIEAGLLEGRLDEFLPGRHRAAWACGGAHELRPDFERLWRESHLDRPWATTMLHAVLQGLMVELARRCAGSDGGPAPVAHEHVDIQRAVLFVDRHFREPLTLASVAAQAHLSANYFSERFRDLTGVSFQSYLQHRRLAFARSLLASTALGVTEVCHAAGFNNLSDFGRAYRNRYGESPTASRTIRTSLAHAQHAGLTPAFTG